MELYMFVIYAHMSPGWLQIIFLTGSAEGAGVPILSWVILLFSKCIPHVRGFPN